MLLPAPHREATAFALEESVCNESCSFKFQSANKLCRPSPGHPSPVSAWYSLSAVLSPITLCTVELCPSKCRPLRTITPDVLRRVTVSPAQSLSTCTSKCALLGSCAGHCSAFLGTPCKYLATRFNCVTRPTWFRHRSCKTLDCFRDVHTVLRPKRFVACSLSRVGLVSIDSASIALNFTLGVLTKLP